MLQSRGAQVEDVGSGTEVLIVGVARALDGLIAAVLLRPGLTRDVPPAPAMFERAAVVGDVGVRGEDLSAVVADRCGADDEAGAAESCGADVGLDAFGAANEGGMRGGGLVEGVEDRTLMGVHRGEFEDVAGADEADRNVTGVIGCAGGADLTRGLEAGLREDQDLRGDGDVERAQHRWGGSPWSGS